MSTLALYMQGWGYNVSGCDQSESNVLVMLRAHGIPSRTGHDASHLEGVDALIYNAAIDEENPEYIAALERGIPMLSRGTLLGDVMARYPKVACISGTHGKTTTSGMLAYIMETEGFRPTIHLGGVLPLIGAAGKMGGKDLLVAEACEYRDSFLEMRPTHSVILNIRPDHLDYFGTLDRIQESFARYAASHPADGYILGYGEDQRVQEVLENAPCHTETYGRTPDCDWQAVDIREEKGFYAFSVYHDGARVAVLQLGIPGAHNVLNALAAFVMAVKLGAEPAAIAGRIAAFSGMKRRMERVGIIGEVPVYHDYAHHPDEVTATLAMARKMASGRIWCIFQPHTYSRTKLLFEDWLNAFGDADRLYITGIYAAREADPGDISSQVLAEALQTRGIDALYVDSFPVCTEKVRAGVQVGDLVITLGAGTIDRINGMLTDTPSYSDGK